MQDRYLGEGCLTKTSLEVKVLHFLVFGCIVAMLSLKEAEYQEQGCRNRHINESTATTPLPRVSFVTFKPAVRRSPEPEIREQE
jgi:hypothetical protein